MVDQLGETASEKRDKRGARGSTAVLIGPFCLRSGLARAKEKKMQGRKEQTNSHRTEKADDVSTVLDGIGCLSVFFFKSRQCPVGHYPRGKPQLRSRIGCGMERDWPVLARTKHLRQCRLLDGSEKRPKNGRKEGEKRGRGRKGRADRREEGKSCATSAVSILP